MGESVGSAMLRRGEAAATAPPGGVGGNGMVELSPSPPLLVSPSPLDPLSPSPASDAVSEAPSLPLPPSVVSALVPVPEVVRGSSPAVVEVVQAMLADRARPSDSKGKRFFMPLSVSKAKKLRARQGILQSLQ